MSTQIDGGLQIQSHTVTSTQVDSSIITSGNAQLVPAGGSTGEVLTKTSGTDYDTEWSSGSGGDVPTPPGDATQFLNGASTPAFAHVTDADLSTTDVTTNNVTSTKHGFAPKSPADAAQFLNGAATPAFASVTKANVGLSAVENTALSTWAGSTSITTVGTIGTGTWNGTAITGASLSMADVTTNNVTSTAHGFAPKSPADAAQFLNGAATPAFASVTKANVGLGNVENTALTTWAGSTSITTLGTIATGTWSGTAIGVAKGGTALTATPANGELPIGNGTNYTLATITQGTGVTVTNGSGTITIARSSPDYIEFYSTDNVTASATAWTSLNSAASLSTGASSGISRSTNRLTFTHTGVYQITMSVGSFNTNCYMGLRLRRTNNTATTLVQSVGYATGTSQTSPSVMTGIFTVVSTGDLIDLQYVISGTGGTFNNTTIDSEVMRSINGVVVQLT
jgi:hypothetical protein